MILLALSPVRFLDVPFRSRLIDAQQFVEILRAEDQGEEGEEEEEEGGMEEEHGWRQRPPVGWPSERVCSSPKVGPGQAVIRWVDASAVCWSRIPCSLSIAERNAHLAGDKIRAVLRGQPQASNFEPPGEQLGHIGNLGDGKIGTYSHTLLTVFPCPGVQSSRP